MAGSYRPSRPADSPWYHSTQRRQGVAGATGESPRQGTIQYGLNEPFLFRIDIGWTQLGQRVDDERLMQQPVCLDQ